MEDERTLEAQEAAEEEIVTDEAEETTEEVDTEEEETVDTLKERLKKTEEERDNYKTGLLKAKKDRKLETKKEDKGDIGSMVRSELHKENEKAAIRAILDPKSDFYIEDCVDGKNWGEIIQFLPRNVDKSSISGVHRSMRAAVAAWKADKGISDKKGKSKEADLAETAGKAHGGDTEAEAPKIIPRDNTDIRDKWFPKKD